MSNELTAITTYHDRTKHHFHRYAAGPGYMDWATQPDPFRRYAGTQLVPLERDGLDGGESGPPYDHGFTEGAVEASPVTFQTFSRLFFDSLALSAWKQAGEARWALRVNPSSGNLHPTEAYLLCGSVDGLSEGGAVYHYAPREHGLERRAEVPTDLWGELATNLPAEAFLIGLSSIHWREAWKYGERAYRYCQHDCGHAVAAIAIAAAGLGWTVRMLDGLGSDEIAALLGLESDTSGAEHETPDCLLCVAPAPIETTTFPDSVIARFADLEWQGTPNRLSASHSHEWPVIDSVSEAAIKPRAADERYELPAVADEVEASGLPLRRIIRQRRSAVSMDGETGLSADTFCRMMRRTLPGAGRVPFTTLPWPPQVHLGVFVHRVEGLDPGLYMLVRNSDHFDELKSGTNPEFEWATPEGCPDGLPFYRLIDGDAREAAEAISCNQAIASDGAFSLGMIARFNEPLEQTGPWMYPRLFWESGAIGQVLYLEAEAAGLRGTGIGCFFDDAMHRMLGHEGTAFQDLYHFTIGGPVEDMRLTTLPAYGDGDSAA